MARSSATSHSTAANTARGCWLTRHWPGGLLTGTFGPDRRLNPGDYRAASPRFSVENRRRIAEMLHQMQPIAERYRFSPAQLVIAWTLHQPGLTHVLCGARNRQQVQKNAAAGDVELSPEYIGLVRDILARHADIVQTRHRTVLGSCPRQFPMAPSVSVTFVGSSGGVVLPEAV
ncbi:MAG: aldo/keto reductase, partial [Thermoguttaceae bacterium]|nr:aldo/keto reductase [Thermoguttaceae bacterium]